MFDSNFLPGATPNPDFQNNIFNNICYNCTKCCSLIEIISINEKDNTIEFICSNQKKPHHITTSIKEYLNKMSGNSSLNQNKDICEIHKDKYMSFCFDCNKHICKECLKARNHMNHYKNNIIEVQPINSEIVIFKDIIKYYDEVLEKYKTKKIGIKNKLKKILNESINDIKRIKENKIIKNEDMKQKELVKKKKELISEIKKIKDKYKAEIRLKKQEFFKKEGKIKNEYILKKENIEMFYEFKIKKLENKCNDILDKISFDKKIEDITNLKSLNELVYNTYDSYNNNYYNSKNINNIIMNLHKSNKQIKNNIQNKVSEEDYEIMIQSLLSDKPNYENKRENNINDNNINDNGNIYELKNDIIEKEKKALLLERELNEIKTKFNKVKDNLEREIEQLKFEKGLKPSLINSNSSENSNEVKEYEDGRYNGRIVNNKREGIGTFYFIDGKIYTGEWKNDNIEGKGIMKYKSGDKYEGFWKDNKREGKGIMKYKNGDKYEGDWKDNKREGKGTLYYNNGNIFEGDWKNDRKHGKYIVYGKKGRKMGYYIEGKSTGKQVILFNNGDAKIIESEKDENENN